jgi:hypothetical protein
MLAAIFALALSSAPVPRLVLHAELGASLPTRLLGELARAKAVDSILSGSSPSAAGQFPCSSGAGVATWQGGTCFQSFLIDASRGTTTSPSTIGWTNWGGGEAIQVVFGDLGGFIQIAYGDRLQLGAYHGVKIYGGRASVAQLPFEAGNGNTDPSLTVVSSALGGGLRIDTSSGTAGAPISFSGRLCITNPGAQGATSCGTVTSALTGAVAGADCVITPPAGFASSVNMHFDCYVPSAGNVVFRQCNSTGTSQTPTAGNYCMRVFNP